jgi:nicotinate phosphoribosyltransferase
VQAADGYAYNIAVKRFNLDYGNELGPFVSTDAQGDWWGGAGGGTVAHAAIASFLGDTAEAMLQFSRILPANIPRIALVDFNNDSVRDTLRVMEILFGKYRELKDLGDETEAAKYVLYGVRLDTSGSLRDVSVEPLGDTSLDLGVTPRLVFNVRQAMDSAWESWNLPEAWKESAREYCRNVKIVASGGFNPEKIRRFERLGVPVDIYGVGSWLFNNNGGTVTDFTGDVVRVKVHGEWIDMAKIGRAPLDNPNLEKVW